MIQTTAKKKWQKKTVNDIIKRAVIIAGSTEWSNSSCTRQSTQPPFMCRRKVEKSQTNQTMFFTASLGECLFLINGCRHTSA